MHGLKVRKVIEVDETLCDGCGACVSACSEGALAIVDGKARLIREDLCDGIGVCIGNCPKGAITIKEIEERSMQSDSFCGCPSAVIKEVESSPLRNWPVQIRLVPPTAPFLRGADLLVVADCVPVACQNFHVVFLKENRVVMIGCPKFDPYEEYVRKFADILVMSGIKSLSVLIMEVPCCRALLKMLVDARSASGVSMSIRVFRIGVDGKVSSEGEV